MSGASAAQQAGMAWRCRRLCRRSPCQSGRHLLTPSSGPAFGLPIRYRDFRHGGRNWRFERADRLGDSRRATGLHRRGSLSRRLRRTCV